MLAELHTRSSANARKRPTSPRQCARGPGQAGQDVDTACTGQHGRRVAARHLFVCTNSRSSGKPACGPRGDALVAAVQLELLVRDGGDALVTSCGCLGPCFDGPNAVIYPDGVWYAG